MSRLITWTFYILVALLPLIFTPTTSELFEFPKFLLLLSATLVISAAWLIDIFVNKIKPQLQITNYKLINYSILAILITQTLATIASIHPYTSFWGYYSRFHQGLLTTICYTILYFAATNYMDKKSTQKLIKISVYTAFLISLYAILQRLGIDKNYWIQDVVNRPFSTLGQPNWLAAYLLPNLFLVLYLSKQKKSVPTIYYLLFTVTFVTLLLTKSRSGFLAFVISYPAYWLLLIRQFSFIKIKTDLVRISSFVFLISLLIGTPFTPSLKTLLTPTTNYQLPATTQGTQLENGGTESGDIRKIVWTGALELIKKYPLLGTGPETFAYTYYWARPVEHNNTSEWDFLYNKAHNEYLNIAATTGLLGLFAYLFFHYAVMRAAFTVIPKTKKVSESDLDSIRSFYPVLGTTIISFAVTNFFGFSVIPVYFLVILLAAFANTLSRPQTNSPLIIDYWLLVIPILLLYPLRLYLADTSYARGKAYLDAARPAEAIPHLSRSSSSRPAEAIFTSTLGEAYAQLGLVDQAQEAAVKTADQNPHHLNFYKSRAKIYLYLSDNVSAARELATARTLAPTDPKLAYNLGLVYSRLARLAEAEQQLKDAINLKPNYPDPYYALTLLYEQSKNTAPIPDLLSQARTNLSTYSSQLKEKIEKYTP